MGIPAEHLGSLDPEDDRPASQQIASRLRAAITAEMRVGDRLPTQLALADHFAVARETIKSALDILELDGVIIRRRGSGSFVHHVPDDPDTVAELQKLRHDLAGLRSRLNQAGTDVRDLEHRIGQVIRRLRAGGHG